MKSDWDYSESWEKYKTCLYLQSTRIKNTSVTWRIHSKLWTKVPICKLEQQTLCYCVIALQVLRQLGASKSHWVLPYADNFLGFGLSVHFLLERKVCRRSLSYSYFCLISLAKVLLMYCYAGGDRPLMSQSTIVKLSYVVRPLCNLHTS